MSTHIIDGHVVDIVGCRDNANYTGSLNPARWWVRWDTHYGSPCVQATDVEMAHRAIHGDTPCP